MAARNSSLLGVYTDTDSNEWIPTLKMWGKKIAVQPLRLTRQQRAFCQNLSNRYAIVTGRGFDFASARLRNQWAEKRCNSLNFVPTRALWPRLCQELSNRFGISYRASWGRADANAKGFWAALSCKSRPAIVRAPVPRPQQPVVPPIVRTRPHLPVEPRVPRPPVVVTKRVIPVGQGCERLGQARSTQGGQSVTMTLTNKTYTTLEVLWLDYEGIAKSPTTVGPGQRHSANTNTKHPWLGARQGGHMQGDRLA